MDRRTAADNKIATTDRRRNCRPVIGYSYVHSAVDDHSRLASSEVLTDERKQTAAAFWRRAHHFSTTHGITVERVFTDNGSCYDQRESGAVQPHPAGRMGLHTAHTSNTDRTHALADFLHTYNHHRSHTALGDHPPISRVNNAADQYT